MVWKRRQQERISRKENDTISISWIPFCNYCGKLERWIWGLNSYKQRKPQFFSSHKTNWYDLKCKINWQENLHVFPNRDIFRPFCQTIVRSQEGPFWWSAINVIHIWALFTTLHAWLLLSSLFSFLLRAIVLNPVIVYSLYYTWKLRAERGYCV